MPATPHTYDNIPTAWPFRAGTRAGARPAVAREAMVATTDRFASEVGVDVLRAGGNAVDAAVAISFALAVVNPEAGNVGGGGFMLLRTAAGLEAAVDFRSTAPGGATRDMFLDEAGGLGERSVIGPLSSAVPGSVRGTWEAHQRFGSLPWGPLVEPAIGLARGFQVTPRLLHSYEPSVIEGLARFPRSAAVFLPGGRPPRLGGTLRQPDLARTLERIRDQGPDGFYLGETADLIVAEMERGGGIITHHDLAGYEAVWREPLRAAYRGHTVVSMPPPSSGGLAVAATAAILKDCALGDLAFLGAEHVHLLAEAWRRAYADRNHYLADPAFADMPLATLASPAYGAWRAKDISREAATPSELVRPGAEAYRESEHTTHFSVVDGQGNAASCTTTINTWYGSKVVAGGTGVLLNNDMDDFSAKPGAPNYFGLVQGPANAIEPGKRPLSAMAPAIVLDPEERLFMVVGTPGGGTIPTTVFQVVSNIVDHGMDLAAAVLAPRVHHQHLPDRIEYEPGGLRPEVVEALGALGHVTFEREELSGDVQAIACAPDGTLQGCSDPRRGGAALGY